MAAGGQRDGGGGAVTGGALAARGLAVGDAVLWRGPGVSMQRGRGEPVVVSGVIASDHGDGFVDLALADGRYRAVSVSGLEAVVTPVAS